MKQYSNIHFPRPTRLPEHIPYVYSYLNCVPTGWQPLLQNLLDKISELDVDIGVLQIKEKFGSLRFYFRGEGKDYDKVHDLVGQAEVTSSETCVVCGEPGTMRHDGWISPYCDKHYKGSKGEEVDVY